MTKRARLLRRAARWIGLAICCVCALAWYVSSNHEVLYWSDNLLPACEVDAALAGGGVWIAWFKETNTRVKSIPEYDREHEAQGFKRIIGRSWYYESDGSLSTVRMSAPRFPTAVYHRAGSSTGVAGPRGAATSGTGAGPIETIWIVSPRWVPFLAAVCVTALVFWLERRARPKKGHCPACGYNLTGLQSGICAECGEKIVPEGAAGSR